MAEEVGLGETDTKPPAVNRLEATLGTVAAVLLFAVMTVTVVDVFGRYFLNAPLPAGYEIVQIGMALLVFVTLPILTARDEQVRIDVFQHLFPRGLKPWLRIASEAISLVVIIGFAWLLWRRGASFVASGETTSNLHAPLAPIAFFVAVSWFAAAAIVAVRLARFRRSAQAGPRP